MMKKLMIALIIVGICSGAVAASVSSQLAQALVDQFNKSSEGEKQTLIYLTELPSRVALYNGVDEQGKQFILETLVDADKNELLEEIG